MILIEDMEILSKKKKAKGIRDEGERLKGLTKFISCPSDYSIGGRMRFVEK